MQIPSRWPAAYSDQFSGEDLAASRLAVVFAALAGVECKQGSSVDRCSDGCNRNRIRGPLFAEGTELANNKI